MTTRRVFGLCLAVLAASSAWAQGECVDNIYATVEESTIHLFHDGAAYNCCPTFDYTLDMAAERIIAHELEIEALCDCICCMDTRVDIEDVAPGDYVIEFHWFEYELGLWLTWEIEVSVPDVGQGIVEPAIAGFGNSGCYDPSTDVSDEDLPVTWSAVKALYR